MFHPEGPTLAELARQALSSTERGYDLLAPRFDVTPFRTPDALLEALLPHLGAADRGLDLCCGTGAGVGLLRRVCRDEVVGVDLSAGMLSVARRAHPADGSPRVTLVRGDVLELAFDAEFDLVTCFGAFGHLLPPELDRLCAVVGRALRPGGRFAFVSADPPPVLSRAWALSRGFNAAMRVRNALWRPPFVMYYLSFCVPRAREALAAAGLTVEVRRGALPAPFSRYAVVVATRP